MTALMVATEKGNMEVVKVLLGAGTDMDAATVATERWVVGRSA